MCWLANLGHHEWREGFVSDGVPVNRGLLISVAEFVGKLLGFDDYVSKCHDA
jgi:hypothetical protein